MANQNFKAAETTYGGFVVLMKWGTIASIAVATLVVLLLAS
ncbi:MAG: aa3-type cytochrome c oxidase subunit IV [Sphingobium sp.]